MELYKFSTNVIGKIIELFNKCLQGVEMPSRWTTALISSIHKKIKKKKYTKYRGLSAIFSMGRLYCRTKETEI